jgi:hypothetical protein
MCRAIRAHAHNIRAQEEFTQAQMAAKSGQWSAIKISELDLLALEDSLVQTVKLSLHTAPRNIQMAEQAESRLLHEEKIDVLKSKSFSKFNALSSSIVGKTFGAFGSLAQYENKECGGTTTYYGQGQLALGQLSTGSQ